MTQISSAQVHKYGFNARNRYSDITNNCGSIVDDFVGFLQDECGLSWHAPVADMYGRIEVRVGPNGEQKHYVFEIDGQLLDGCIAGEDIWIDLSFDQFNDTNKQNGVVDVSYGPKKSIEPVQIITPSDARRGRYMTIGEFFSKAF